MEDFLSSYDRKSTSRMYKRGLDLFLEWYGKDIEAVLAERKNDLTVRANENLVEAKQRAKRFEKLLEKFHSYLLQNEYKLNTARTYCLGILQLFRYHEMGITLRNGSPIVDTVISTGDFILLPDHVRAMFHVARDLRSKLLISMGNDLGWRISDIISIGRDELPLLEQKPPIEWARITKKVSHVVAKTCLSKTTVLLLKEYLFSVPTKNPFLFNHNGEGHISEETVNARLRDLARDAGIELGFTKLHWHCFRKMVISTAKNLSIDPDIIKLMVGKSVKKDILTYMTGIDVKTAFNKLQGVLGITSLTEADEEEEVKTLKEEVTHLNEQLDATRIVMMGLFGINRKQVEEQIMKALGGRHKLLKADVGGLTAEKFVTKMSDKTLCNLYVAMRRDGRLPEVKIQHLSPEQVTQTKCR